MIKIVITGCTHNRYPVIQPCDIFIHTGDFTEHGSISELAQFKLYLDTIQAKYIILVPGNHDRFLEKEPLTRNMFKDYYLFINEGIHIYDLDPQINIWGSPYTPPWDNWAFNAQDKEREEIFKKISPSTDILITHGPPKGILDQTKEGQNAGCQYLLEQINSSYSIRYHFFAHIHETYGSFLHKDIQIFNVSLMNKNYQPFNPPITIEIE